MSATNAHTTTVGCRAVALQDPVQGVKVPLWLLYPARAAEQPERFGRYTLAVAMDAPVLGERLPLVVISHGTGGSPFVYRDLAAHLARTGHLVALLVHPGNNRDDDSLSGTAANLENRPRHVSLAIDAVFSTLAAHVSTIRVAVIGHSLGGYTALAVAGGRPFARASETPEGKERPLAVVHDTRVRALVLLAPAVPWFMPPGSLAEVTAPILLRTGEHDRFTPAIHAEILTRGLPATTSVDARVVANAGHFSFLSPFPPEMLGPNFPPGIDPPGFYRAAYVPVLCAEVSEFLARTL